MIIQPSSVGPAEVERDGECSKKVVSCTEGGTDAGNAAEHLDGLFHALRWAALEMTGRVEAGQRRVLHVIVHRAAPWLGHAGARAGSPG